MPVAAIAPSPPSINLGRCHQSDMDEIAMTSDQYYHNHLRAGAVDMGRHASQTVEPRKSRMVISVSRRSTSACIAAWALLSASACFAPAQATLTFSGSSVGREGEVIRLQLQRFRQAHSSIRVELRPTPDAADQRHQLYVQWLNARSVDPDVLQLDVVWTPEFAAAG